MPQVRGGNIKIFGVAADTRLPSAPDVPTVDEAGLPGYHVALWHGLWMPKGTPKPIMTTLNAAVIGALADPAVRGSSPISARTSTRANEQTPEALGALQKAEIAKWWPIIKAGNIKVE